MTESFLDRTNIELGIIISVNPDECTCTVRSEMSETYHENIPIMIPALHPQSGSSISYFPQGGETVLICTTTDRQRFILGYIPIINEESNYSANRDKRNSGDIHLTGADGNFLYIYRGGVLRIGSNNICQSIYIPYKSLQHHIAENFIIDTFAGSIEFLTNRKEDDENGKQKTELNIKVLEYSDDKEETVLLTAGSGILLKIKDSGSETFSMNIKKDGQIDVSSKKGGNFTFKEKLSIKTNNDIDISSANLKIETTSKITEKAQTIENIATNINITGNVNISGGTVKLSESAISPILVASPGFMAWIAAISAKNTMPTPADIFINSKVLG